ncbi:MAG TPA: hypothetical protein DIC42_02155 [Holosporales bacterium]|nr:hypothetical protein [Holosporales bacterium]
MGPYLHVNSMGDIFEKHYGKIGRIICGIFIVLTSVACVAQQMIAMGFIFEYFLNIQFLYGALISCAIAIVYSAAGGIRAVVKTDVIQFIIIAAFVPLLFLCAVNYKEDTTSFTTFPFEKLNPLYDIKMLPHAVTLFFVMSISALGPSVIHRLIMSKDIKQAIFITKTTGFLTVALISLLAAIALFSFAVDPHINSQAVLPFAINKFMPPFLIGASIAALLSVLMSTLDSVLHVVCLACVQDILLPLIKSKPTEKTQILLMKGTTVIIGIASVLLADHFKNIMDIIVFSVSFWGPTILIPFTYILYKKIFSQKTFILGTVCGLLFVSVWNLAIKKYLFLDGYIPGVLFSFIFFHLSPKTPITEKKSNLRNMYVF